jgi:hypothetical protein
MADGLHTLMQAILPQQQGWELYLTKHWKEIIGNLSQHVRLEKTYETTVVLGVYDTHWMHELYLFSNILLDKINAALEEPTVTHLRFKKVNRPVVRKKSSSQYKAYQAPAIELTTKEEKALSEVSDPELTDVLKNFLIRCHRQERMWKKRKK